MLARNLFQPHHGRVPLAGSLGWEDFRADDEPVTILRQQIPVVAQLGFLAIALPRQQGIEISRGLVRFVAALLSVEIYRGIAGVIRRRILPIFTLKALQTRPSFDQREI